MILIVQLTCSLGRRVTRATYFDQTSAVGPQHIDVTGLGISEDVLQLLGMTIQAIEVATAQGQTASIARREAVEHIFVVTSHVSDRFVWFLAGQTGVEPAIFDALSHKEIEFLFESDRGIVGP